MAIPRKDALKTLNGLAPKVKEHLQKLTDYAGHSSQYKWRGEIRGWLGQMKEALLHVGKKTSASWQVRLDQFQSQLDAFDK